MVFRLLSTQLVGLWHLHFFLLSLLAHFVCCLQCIRSLQQSPSSVLSLFVTMMVMGKWITRLGWLIIWFRYASARFLSYFTDLSYIGLVAYFWASSIQTLAFSVRGRKTYPLQSWPRILQFLHVFLHTTITVFRESYWYVILISQSLLSNFLQLS